MAVFNEPTKWAQALGATANADVIPDEAGATDVDISKIFPAVFSVPLSQGGKAIPRRTLNGILKLLGDWLFYNQNGGVPSYNADFDYTVGRFVSYNGGLYKCIQNNVHTAPHNPTDKDYWTQLLDNSQFDIDEIVTDLNGKADRSLSNVDNTANILMAHNAMPSDNFDTLTMGASGTVYTAPADGFFWAAVEVQGSQGFVEAIIRDSSDNYIYTSNNFGTLPRVIPCILLPVKKGDTATISYTDTTSPYELRFIYAVGSKSEEA